MGLPRDGAALHDRWWHFELGWGITGALKSTRAWDEKAMAYKESKKNDIAGRNNWYRQCVSTKTVLVEVFPRTKYAKVEWDYISVPKERDRDFYACERRLRESLKEIYLKYAGSQSEFYGGGLVGYIDGLLISDARLAAEQISKLFEGIPQLPPE